MKKNVISTPEAPSALGPYSCGIKSEPLVFLSGQLGLGVDGKLVGETIGEQTFQVLRNIEYLLEAAGLDLRYVVKTTVFLTAMSDFDEMNAIYGMHFSAPYPARTTIQVAALPKGAKIEIECIADTRLVFDEIDDPSLIEKHCEECEDGCCGGCE